MTRLARGTAERPAGRGRAPGSAGDAPARDARRRPAAGRRRARPRDLDELAAKAEKADEYLALAQRTQADFENYRKRAAREAAVAQERGATKLAKELLPAIDNLDRALAHADEAAADDGGNGTESLVAGIKHVHADLIAALRRASGSSPTRPRASRLTRSTTRRSRSSRSRASSPASWSRSSSAATASARASCARRASSSPAEGGGERQWLTGPTTTRSSGSARTPPTRRSRRRTASSRASTTRTATRATSRPRSASRRSRRRTTSCPIPTSARSTTAAALFGGFGRRPAAASIRARSAAASATSSPTCSGRGRRRHARRPGGRGTGGRRARGRAQRGRDLETEVSLTFDQAVNGAQVSLAVPTSQPCPTCNGSGAKPGTSPRVCPVCNGRGVEAQSQGIFSMSQPCSNCHGSGTVIDDPCPTCEGTRRPALRPAAARQHPRRASGTAAASGWPARASPGLPRPGGSSRPATCT